MTSENGSENVFRKRFRKCLQRTSSDNVSENVFRKPLRKTIQKCLLKTFQKTIQKRLLKTFQKMSSENVFGKVSPKNITHPNEYALIDVSLSEII